MKPYWSLYLVGWVFAVIGLLFMAAASTYHDLYIGLAFFAGTCVCWGLGIWDKGRRS